MFSPCRPVTVGGANLSLESGIWNLESGIKIEPLHRQSTINLNDLSGDIARDIRQQKRRDVRNLISFGESAEGNLLENFRLITLVETAGHVRSNHAES